MYEKHECLKANSSREVISKWCFRGVRTRKIRVALCIWWGCSTITDTYYPLTNFGKLNKCKLIATF